MLQKSGAADSQNCKRAPQNRATFNVPRQAGTLQNAGYQDRRPERRRGREASHELLPSANLHLDAFTLLAALVGVSQTVDALGRLWGMRQTRHRTFSLFQVFWSGWTAVSHSTRSSRCAGRCTRTCKRKRCRTTTGARLRCSSARPRLTCFLLLSPRCLCRRHGASTQSVRRTASFASLPLYQVKRTSTPLEVRAACCPRGSS